MLQAKKSQTVFKKVNLVLMKGADRLTGDDLVRITKVAEEAGASLYISVPSWQVFLGVPVTQQQQVLIKLRERGYDSVRVTRKVDHGFPLQLSDETADILPQVVGDLDRQMDGRSKPIRSTPSSSLF